MILSAPLQACLPVAHSHIPKLEMGGMIYSASRWLHPLADGRFLLVSRAGRVYLGSGSDLQERKFGDRYIFDAVRLSDNSYVLATEDRLLIARPGARHAQTVCRFNNGTSLVGPKIGFNIPHQLLTLAAGKELLCFAVTKSSGGSIGLREVARRRFTSVIDQFSSTSYGTPKLCIGLWMVAEAGDWMKLEEFQFEAGKLATVGKEAAPGLINDIRYSPSGRYLAFTDGFQRTVCYDSRIGVRRRVVQNTGRDAQIGVMDDGTVLSCSREQDPDLILLTRPGQKPIRIDSSNFEGYPEDILTDPSGRFLIAARVGFLYSVDARK